MTDEAIGAFDVEIEPVIDLSHLETAWDRLDGDGSHSFFVSRPWIFSWLRTLPSSCSYSVAKFLSKGQLIGLAIVTQRTNRFYGVFPIKQAWLNATGDPAYDCIMIEHNGVASCVAQGLLLKNLVHHLRTKAFAADELVFPGLDTVSYDHDSFLRSASTKRGYRIDLARLDTLENVLASLSQNSRQRLRPAIGRLLKIGPLSVCPAANQTAALADFELLKQAHIRQWQDRNGSGGAFQNPYFETFCRELISSFLPGAHYDLLRVSAGSQILGYLFNFLRKGVVSSYATGFLQLDRNKYGYVSHIMAIQHYSGLGFDVYDLLVGGNQLKRTFSNHGYELTWERLRKPKAIFHIDALARSLTDGAACTI